MLYEFQEMTINTIVEKFETQKILVLLGEKDSGKSSLAKELKNYLVDTCTMYFLGAPSREYTDFGCFPQSLLDGFNKKLSKRAYSNGVKKDIAATVANLVFISVENTLESFLTSNEKSEINNIIYYITKLSEKKKICLIFDNIEYYDRKSMVFLYNIISLSLRENISKIKTLVVLDQTKGFGQNILNQELLEQLPQISLFPLTDNDLSAFLDCDDYSIGREIPIKYLLELRGNVKNLAAYYNQNLNSISQDNINIKRLLYTLVLLDEDVSFSNLAIFLSDIPITEICQGLEVLKNNFFIEWYEIENDIFYTVPDLIKTAIRQEIPLHLSLNRFEIYTRQIEQYSPLDYVLKFWLYCKAGNMNNAYANAILAYCSIARGETSCTNKEIVAFDGFLQNSVYDNFYKVLSKAYRLYNTNEYEKCYTYINDYLINNQFIEGKSIFFSVYIPEYIYEMIFLRGMCISRLPDCSEALIRNQQRLLEHLIEIVNLSPRNNEFILKLREQKLLLKTYISVQTKKGQKEIYNEYFSICNQYQSYIRQSTIRTREKWEIRYASFLLKANIVSGIPDKLHILEKGYGILHDNKNLYPEKYLKAACNLAGDYMWRDKANQSQYILENAVQFIENRNWLQYWGVIYQMYIFSKLYGSASDTPEELFRDYFEKIWDFPEIRFKMHEMPICNSNYVILLASVEKFEEAHELLKRTFEQTHGNMNKYNDYLLSTNLGMIKYLLGDISGALELEEHCNNLIENRLVPTFSPAFIKKRTLILLDIYSQKKTVDNILSPLSTRQTLSTGYCSDNYFRPLLFSDINYWAD